MIVRSRYEYKEDSSSKMPQEKDATKYPYNKPTQLFIIHINEPSLHSNKAKAPHVWLNVTETEDVVLVSKEEGKGRQV